MKVWILLCLLLQDTSHAQTPSVDSSGDDIRIIRTDLDLVVAGRVEVYVEGEWRAVCHSNWGENDARVACRQLGFPDGGARNCRESCFGKSTLSAGLSNFMCNGNESRLTDCQSDSNNGCGEDAGVICRNVITTTSSPLSPLTPQQGQFTPVVTTITQQVTATQQGQCTPVTTTIMQQSFTSGAQGACKEETTNCTALVGGLVGLTALMTLLLVLVVLGWVCSCYRRRKYTIKESRNATFHNPVYNTTAPNPSNQYSLNGPQDMLSQYDSTYNHLNIINKTKDGKNNIQEVGGVVPHHNYEVITTENIHEEDDRTDQGEAPSYSVLAKVQREGEETEEGKPTTYSVLAKSQKEGERTDEGKRALFSVVAKPKKEEEHTDEGKGALIANPQETPTSTEYSRLHYNY